ncbi:MAG TPA: NUDIX hydrolase N-terminal domain-containing protein [Bacilli bacterium]|nr:NUDIX hydrolase N-terminal domain-containing protein [Bacilli bacterium]
MNQKELYNYLIKIQAITKIGLLYSTDPYAVSNYKEIEALTKAMLEDINKVKITENNYFKRDIYPTPNISVRTIIWNEKDEFLMVQEKADNGFSFPGGWCDLYDSPEEAGIREAREEGGVDIQITELVGVFNRTPFKHPVSVPEYVIIYNARLIKEVSKPDHEIISVKWVKNGKLPPLSSKVTAQEIVNFIKLAVESKKTAKR